jgi:predicted CXXCH cytochrome family protein
VRLRVLLAGLTLLVSPALMRSQASTDVLGAHNMGPGGGSHITGARTDACAYCHAPHSGLNMGLWNQKLTTQTYTMYTSNTEKNTGVQPALASSSNMCLSCHDGTVAVGSTVAYGQVTMSGSMNPIDVFASKMQSSHPFNLVPQLKDNVDLVASLAANGKTADPTGAVHLVGRSVECTSCHTPHVQAKDMLSHNFLVRDGSSGQMCLACHDPSRTMSGQVNPLADWAISAHANAGNKIYPAAQLGSYTTVAMAACISCHTPHNAGSTARVLRGQDEADCIACHGGSSNVDMPQQYTNIVSELGTGKTGHPYPTLTSSNPHDEAEGSLLNNNRHASCVDCHNGHASQAVQGSPAAPQIRVSQKDVAGISASDGISVVSPAVNQYEVCLRCHGTSSGKQALAKYGYLPVRAVSAGDPLNLLPQFAVAATSSHPVTHSSSSALAQPSLLSNMLYLDGSTQGRAMGTQIFCTDCHNSDDNREFGGSGPSGPHGSKWTHVLERRYEFSQASAPGETITNLFQNPDLGATGPYAMCAKCHDLPNQIIKNTSWSQHAEHINAGFSCSVCHTAHGMGASSGSITGQRMINFDVNVVAPNGSSPISYTYAAGQGTCALVCHGVTHNSDGSVSQVRRIRGPLGVRTAGNR